MALVERLMERRDSLENPATPISNAWDVLRGPDSSSGIQVDEKKALSSTAVLSAVRLLAETAATIPLNIYRRRDDRGRELADTHPLFSVLHDAPNPEMSCVNYREAMMVHLLMWGDHFAEKQMDGRGNVERLWPLLPDRTKLARDGGQFVVVTRINNEPKVLQRERVLHIAGISTDGRHGWGLVQMAREAIGLTLATEKFGAKFFGSGSHLGGTIEHPETLSDKAEKHLRSSWERMHTGLDNAHRVAILEEGARFNQLGVPPEAAQFLETRKFQVGEVARLFRVPNHMIGDLDRATFSNIEQQSLEFVVYSLRSWLVRIEKAMGQQLLSRPERNQGGLFIEHVVEGLLRGDTETRFNAYQQAINHGWMSPNEVRQKENMNPIDGGDRYFVRRDLMPLDQADLLAAPPERSEPQELEERVTEMDAEQRSIDARRELAQAFRSVFDDSMGRMVRAEVQDLRSALSRVVAEEGVGGFLRFLDFFYTDADEMASIIQRIVAPPFSSYAGSVSGVAGEEVDGKLSELQIRTFLEGDGGYLDQFVKRYSASSRRQLVAVVEDAREADADPEEQVNQRLDEWVEGSQQGRPRAERWADREVHRLGNAITKETYIAAGIILLRWRELGESCPYCRALDGKIVDIRGNFVNRGENFDPEGADGPLSPSTSIGHPPLHSGCDCVITPGTRG